MRLLVADSDLKPRAGRCDAQVPVAETPDQVEGLSRRLLLGQPHGVVGDVLLDGLPDLGRRSEVAIGGNQPIEGLVWALKIVTVDEEREPAHVVGEVGKDGPAQKLVPQCLPETLGLAEGLGVLGSAAGVADAVTPQRALEVRLAPPGRVLRPVVGQNLLGRPEGGDAALERLEHELRALVMGRRVRDDETRVVVHENRQVHPLVASEQKREDVGLPELIGRRALEASHRVLSRLARRRRRLEQPGLVQDAAHLRLAHAERLESGQDVPDAPRPVLRMLLAELRHGRALRLPVWRRRPTRWRP